MTSGSRDRGGKDGKPASWPCPRKIPIGSIFYPGEIRAGTLCLLRGKIRPMDTVVMNLIVNGQPTESQASTVIGLLTQLDLAGRPVLVERNRVAIFPREFETTSLHDGDEIEIIQLAAGG